MREILIDLRFDHSRLSSGVILLTVVLDLAITIRVNFLHDVLQQGFGILERYEDKLVTIPPRSAYGFSYDDQASEAPIEDRRSSIHFCS